MDALVDDTQLAFNNGGVPADQDGSGPGGASIGISPCFACLPASTASRSRCRCLRRATRRDSWHRRPPVWPRSGANAGISPCIARMYSCATGWPAEEWDLGWLPRRVSLRSHMRKLILSLCIIALSGAYVARTAMTQEGGFPGAPRPHLLPAPPSRYFPLLDLDTTGSAGDDLLVPSRPHLGPQPSGRRQRHRAGAAGAAGRHRLGRNADHPGLPPVARFGAGPGFVEAMCSLRARRAISQPSAAGT